MPLRLTAGTVPGGDATARACEEERRQGRRMRVRPAGAGRAAAACRRRHREGVGGCGACGGAGWVLCDFCQGKKNNVKSETGSRVYRRCPTCKAAGFILCPRCRVYKCVTFPESTES
ncbi:uncharacterized protein [Zea mays]|uniref:uncharacterized protein isoform X1 n=1 Tax=Zea mays TaxID=4577 RepID=UPI001651C74C|nr:uncharacterized protein LOC100275637 isoform X1 [Zea mays]